MLLHRCYGVYSDGSYKRNAVASEDLNHHISFNRQCRPGRALIVGGLVFNNGYLTTEQIDAFIAKLPDLNKGWDPNKPSVPYQ